MKRLVSLVLAGICTLSFVGMTSAGQNNTGCGIGTMVFEGQEGVMSQVLAATTNGTFGNQTFGITSGTLNCEKPAAFVSNEKLNTFVADNMDNLAMDISKGSGEYLSTLAVLMDTPVAERPALYSTLQTNFSDIYSSESVTHIDVLNNIEKVVVAS